MKYKGVELYPTACNRCNRHVAVYKLIGESGTANPDVGDLCRRCAIKYISEYGFERL